MKKKSIDIKSVESFHDSSSILYISRILLNNKYVFREIQSRQELSEEIF